VPEITLRCVTKNDENLLFEWRNINELVALSYYQKKVTIKEHKKWLVEKLISSDCELFIIQKNNEGIGLIRMDLNVNKYELSIYLIPGSQGMGFGFIALSQLLKSLKNKAYQYIAKVQITNIPSQKLFIKLNFIETSRDNSFIIYKKKST
jgi:RimJ/RimL family protein N-acetyltransferase